MWISPSQILRCTANKFTQNDRRASASSDDNYYSSVTAGTRKSLNKLRVKPRKIMKLLRHIDVCAVWRVTRNNNNVYIYKYYRIISCVCLKWTAKFVLVWTLLPPYGGCSKYNILSDECKTDVFFFVFFLKLKWILQIWNFWNCIWAKLVWTISDKNWKLTTTRILENNS